MDSAATTRDPGVMDELAVEASDFDECFRRHFPRLVRSLGAGVDDAEAAVQEAFVEAHLRWRTVSRLEDPVGWIRRVAIRRILNQHRSLGRRLRAVERLGADARDTDDASLSFDVDLAAAIRALPLRQRLVLVLHHLEGLPVRAVADAMGISDGTVKSQLHDARANLRPLLEVRDV
jgi:RNA polymerase sigma-70 factor, ECF subfamily